MYRAKIGHVHLKVRHLATSVKFYCDVLHFQVTEQVAEQFAFLSGGDLHHELALQQIGASAVQPPSNAVGLYHTAFEVADKQAFALAWQKLKQLQVAAVAVDHGISWAMYFADPDRNGVEIYVDTRHEPTGRTIWQGYTRPLTSREIESRLIK